MKITVECRMRNEDITLEIPLEEWAKYQSGMHIQDALKSLDAGQRELLISKTCEACFDRIFIK